MTSVLQLMCGCLSAGVVTAVLQRALTLTLWMAHLFESLDSAQQERRLFASRSASHKHCQVAKMWAKFDGRVRSQKSWDGRIRCEGP